MQRVEFTIEPFVEGRPGPHVTAAVAAAQSLGVDVELGPFGSGCTARTARTHLVVSAIVEAALANGATHVNIDVTAIDDQTNDDER